MFERAVATDAKLQQLPGRPAEDDPIPWRKQTEFWSPISDGGLAAAFQLGVAQYLQPDVIEGVNSLGVGFLACAIRWIDENIALIERQHEVRRSRVPLKAPILIRAANPDRAVAGEIPIPEIEDRQTFQSLNALGAEAPFADILEIVYSTVDFRDQQRGSERYQQFLDGAWYLRYRSGRFYDPEVKANWTDEMRDIEASLLRRSAMCQYDNQAEAATAAQNQGMWQAAYDFPQRYEFPDLNMLRAMRMRWHMAKYCVQKYGRYGTATSSELNEFLSRIRVGNATVQQMMASRQPRHLLVQLYAQTFLMDPTGELGDADIELFSECFGIIVNVWKTADSVMAAEGQGRVYLDPFRGVRVGTPRPLGSPLTNAVLKTYGMLSAIYFPTVFQQVWYEAVAQQNFMTKRGFGALDDAPSTRSRSYERAFGVAPVMNAVLDQGRWSWIGDKQLEDNIRNKRWFAWYYQNAASSSGASGVSSEQLQREVRSAELGAALEATDLDANEMWGFEDDRVERRWQYDVKADLIQNGYVNLSTELLAKPLFANLWKNRLSSPAVRFYVKFGLQMYPDLVEQLWKDRFRSLDLAPCFDFVQYNALAEDQKKKVVRALDQRLHTLVEALADIGKVKETITAQQAVVINELQAIDAQRVGDRTVLVDAEQTSDANVLYSSLFERIDTLFYAYTDPVGYQSESLYSSQLRDPTAASVPGRENIVEWLQAEFGITEPEDLKLWVNEFTEEWAESVRKWFRSGKEYARWRTRIRLSGIAGHKKWVSGQLEKVRGQLEGSLLVSDDQEAAQQRRARIYGELEIPVNYDTETADLIYRREEDALEAAAAAMRAANEQKRARDEAQQPLKIPRRKDKGSSSASALAALESERKAVSYASDMIKNPDSPIPGMSDQEFEEGRLAQQIYDFEVSQGFQGFFGVARTSVP